MDRDQEVRFQQVALPHLDAAYNLARWLTGNSADADDVTQEAFLRAFRFFDTFRGEDARTWLLKIVRNTYYTLWRQGRRRDESTEFDEEMHSMQDEDPQMPAFGRADLNPESIARRGEDIRLLDQALQAIPVEYRETLVLREIEDLSYKQIAETLGIPMGTVMSRIARGRRMLRDAYERLAEGTPEAQPVASAPRRIR